MAGPTAAHGPGRAVPVPEASFLTDCPGVVGCKGHDPPEVASRSVRDSLPPLAIPMLDDRLSNIAMADRPDVIRARRTHGEQRILRPTDDCAIDRRPVIAVIVHDQR